MKHLYHIIYLLLFPLFILGQEEIQVELKWQGIRVQQTVKEIEIHTISFENNTHLYDYASLPVYKTEIALPSEFFGCELQFDIQAADTLSEEESFTIADTDLLQSELLWQVNYRHLTAGLFVVPMKVLPEDGRILLIKEFSIRVNLVPVEPNHQAAGRDIFFTDNSVLGSGSWYKIGITQTGVHKISYTDLQSMGINATNLDIEKIGIFGNYKGMLPEANAVPRTDDLMENAIKIVGDADGEFNEGDYILFNANSALIWEYNLFSSRFRHENNLYTDTTYYFLTTSEGSGKRIETIASATQQPTFILHDFVDYSVHDKDFENLIYSGKEWFGERFTGDTLERTFSFDFPNKIDESPVYMEFELIARAFTNSYYQVFVNDNLVIDSISIAKIHSGGSIHARRATKSVTFFTDGDQIDVKVKYLTDDITSNAWLEKIVLNVKRALKFGGGQMAFRNPQTAASGNLTKFEIENASNEVIVWDITDNFNPLNVAYQQSGNSIHYTLATDSLREFIICDEESFLEPVSFSAVQNQNLHSITEVDFVIVSNELFLEQANRLAAIHESVDGMDVLVVTPEQIYNEFSSGSQDVSAIRDFMRMLYQREAFGEASGYLLLFGDASYDYKHRVHDNTNFVPTYESAESLRHTSSYVTDDFFGLLNEDEGTNCTGELDIGIGRFPVSDIEQATTAVDKVEHYLTKSKKLMRDWRSQLCFIADDGDNNLHLHQAKQLIEIADTLHPGFRINKIFSDAFAKITVPGGKRFPEVNALIDEQVERGALIVNYTGHGGLIGWSEEMILDLPMIHSFSNYDNLPLFITATCEFSRFDDPEFVSAGEFVYLNEHGGSIALLTTTRLAYAHANIVVNRRIYNNLLKKVNGEIARLGDLVRLSKNPSDSNYLNFVLLGDPALRLAFPEYEVKTIAINSEVAGTSADTIRAMQEVMVQGEIINSLGSPMNNFNGFIYPKVYDKPSNYSTQGNDGSSYPEEFQLTDKLLFDGRATVKNGQFEFSFVVPKDISHEYGFGKISYYALDTTHMVDAWGAYENLVVGGIDPYASPDNTGPVIQIYLEDRTFSSGDATSSKPLLLADISDDQGISYTGLGLGRDIVMVVDGDYTNSMIMNPYFNIDTDSYKSGEIIRQLGSLQAGWHKLSIKAWDLHNNSSEAEVDFYVDENGDVQLTNVVSYPNPFIDAMNFDFRHNKSNSKLEVEINIYDINGRFITTIFKQLSTNGFTIEPIEWNGEGSDGNKIDPGVYMYNIIVTDAFGNKAVQKQKFIKIN
ncbi:MAG: type IX secretion system sortase PorU [Bacteroidetes bacterium]|nr:type IX secretion system sortase PorU [Bacteroidota bacterium]